MACTTILVGKAASYDGSTMIARNDDSGSGHFTAKKFTVIHPEDLPKTYRSVLSHVEIPLPEGALRFTAMPNAVEGKGIWAASGVNAANVGMTATETITSNPRVLGADPLVEYQPAKGEKPEVPGGIGEEDIVYLVFVSLVPEFLNLRFNVPFYFGGTSLLIVVVVTMDFMSQVQAYLMTHQYESLLRKTNFRGLGQPKH